MTVASLKIHIGAEWGEARRAFNEVSAAVRPMADRMTDVGRTMTTRVTLPLALAGAAAVKFAGDFEQSLRNAASVTGLTGDAAAQAEGQMRALAMQLGRETAFTAKQAADAMYDLASSGWDAGEMARGLPGILALAAATQNDLGATTETVTATLAQFGLDASESARVADVFTAAIGSSKANMDRLAPSLRMVGPVAAALGMSLEETTAALSALYDAGFTGETAGTALRGVLASLSAPSNQAAQALAGLGVTLDMVNPQTNSLAAIMDTLQAAGMDSATAFQVFGREAAPAVMQLLDQGEGLRQFTANLENAGGAAERVAGDQLDTFNGQMTILIGSIQTAAIAFGTVLLPHLQSVAEALIPLVNHFAELDPAILTVIAVVGGLVAAIGPLLLAVGTALKLLPLMAAGFAVLTGPIGLTVMAVAGLVAAFWVYRDDIARILGIVDRFVATHVGNVLRGVLRVVSALNSLDRAFGLAPILGGVESSLGAMVKEMEDRAVAGLGDAGGQAGRAFGGEFRASVEQAMTGATPALPQPRVGGVGGGSLATPAAPTLPFQGVGGLTPRRPVLGDMFGTEGLQAALSTARAEVALFFSESSLAAEAFLTRMIETSTALAETIRGGLADAFSAVATSLGEMFAGTNNAESLGNRLLSVLAGVMQKLGGLLVAFATAGIKFQSAGGFFSFLTNPWAALAAGGLLIAAGAAIKGMLASAGGSGASGSVRGTAVGSVSVNPNAGATAGGGSFGGAAGSAAAGTQHVTAGRGVAVLPRGDLAFAVEASARSLDTYGTRPF